MTAALLGKEDLALPLDAAEALLLACRTVAGRHPEGNGADANQFDMLAVQLAAQAIVGSAMAAELGAREGDKAVVRHDRFEALWLGLGSGMGHALSNCATSRSMTTAMDTFMMGMAQAMAGRVGGPHGPTG